VSTKIVSGEHYRRRKDDLRRLLGDRDSLRGHWSGDALERLFSARTAAILPVRDSIKALEQGGADGNRDGAGRGDGIFRSLVHLHCNRLLATDRVMEERVIGLLGHTRLSLVNAPLP
jgi:hypothetical protein